MDNSKEKDITIYIKRSRRRSLEIQISKSKEVIVRAPLRTPHSEIRAFIQEHKEWIQDSLKRAKAQELAYQDHLREIGADKPYTEEELLQMKKDAIKLLPSRCEYYASLMGVSYNRIAIKAQRSRWGSCSAKKNLNFNCLLMLCPEEIQDYVVVHELSHLKEMNHSPAFWAEVGKILPDYKKRRRWLRSQGEALIARLP